MKKYKIIIDSSCDLVGNFAEENDIYVTNLIINFGNESYIDKIEINGDEIIKKYNETKIFPKTSTLNIADLEKLLTSFLDEYEHVFYFTISSKISSLYNNAKLAARKHSDRITVIDSANLSGGFSMLMYKFVDLIKEGLSPKELEEEIEKYKSKAHIRFIIDTLDFLHKGGRCSGMTNFVGRMLRVHPIVNTVDGKMVVEKVLPGKTINNCISEFSDYFRNLVEKDRIDLEMPIIFSGYGFDPVIPKQIKENLKDIISEDKFLSTTVSGIIVCHCGPSTFGMGYMNK